MEIYSVLDSDFALDDVVRLYDTNFLRCVFLFLLFFVYLRGFRKMFPFFALSLAFVTEGRCTICLKWLQQQRLVEQRPKKKLNKIKKKR